MFLASRAVLHCVTLCHQRSGDAAARRWLRTYGGRNRGRRSGSLNRLLLDFRWPASPVKAHQASGRFSYSSGLASARPHGIRRSANLPLPGSPE
jgi:hypothetical protein